MVYITAIPQGLSRREQVKTEHLSGWALLRLGLLRRGLCPPEATATGILSRVQRGAGGKPFLPEPGCQFNISHSRGLAGCAVEAVPVGLDLERVREFSPGMIGKICTAEEVRITGGEGCDTLLTQLWTCKESHMKFTGLGFSQGLHETEFCALGAEPRMKGREDARFHSISFRHGEDTFWLTLCSGGPVDFQVEWIDFADLNIL